MKMNQETTYIYTHRKIGRDNMKEKKKETLTEKHTIYIYIYIERERERINKD